MASSLASSSRFNPWQYPQRLEQVFVIDNSLEGDMDVPKSCVGKRTRSQCQKAEEELLNKARMLKAERDKKKKAVKMSSKDPASSLGLNSSDENRNQVRHVANRSRSPHQKAEEELLNNARVLKDGKDKKKKGIKMCSKDSIKKRSSKDLADDEGSSSDIEIIGEGYVPLDQRRELRLPMSRIARLHRSIIIEPIDRPVLNRRCDSKESGAPSRSNSVSTFREEDDDEPDDKDEGDESLFFGGKSNDLFYFSEDDL